MKLLELSPDRSDEAGLTSLCRNNDLNGRRSGASTRAQHCEPTESKIQLPGSDLTCWFCDESVGHRYCFGSPGGRICAFERRGTT